MISLALALLLAAEGAPGPSYDDLLAQGLAAGRDGRLAEAGSAFDRAIGLDPKRPEALVERGGLRFLESRYDAAVSDLERALRLREDGYTRDLLASSLYLAGRGDDALACWNAMRRPLVGALAINGLERTKDRVARRELSLSEGGLLDLGELRASRARLRETGVFERVTLRPIPRGEGRADLEVALVERHGLYQSLTDFVASTLVNALNRRVRLRYSNLAGSGLSFGGQYRWQANRPEASLAMDWPRPAGLPFYVHVLSFRGEQAYDLGDAFVRRSRGIDVSLRRVLGAHGVGSLALRARDRTFTRPDPVAPPGLVLGIEAGLERRLVDAHRQRLDSSARVFQALPAVGSDLRFTRAVASLQYQGLLSRPDGSSIERSVLAARVLWGGGSDETPLDEMFAPGGSQDMELPLRAHYQTRRGVLGEVPIGRSLVLANLEWRSRVKDAPAGQLGIVVFADIGHVGQPVRGGRQTLVDTGFGLRLALRAGPLIRLDFGHGLTDGRNALFVGLGQVF